MSSFSHLKGEYKWERRKPGCWSLAGGDLLINTFSVCPKERHTDGKLFAPVCKTGAIPRSRGRCKFLRRRKCGSKILFF